jgi:hypothetical protein
MSGGSKGDGAVTTTERAGLLGGVLLALGCGGGAPAQRIVTPPPAPTPAQLTDDLALLQQGRILFSHHSVGVNLISGVQRLDAELAGGQLKAARVDETPVDGPVLGHISGGKNGDPDSKLRFFGDFMRSRAKPLPQVAFMKFCYVDFDPSTDVSALFARYRDTIEALRREFPAVRFAHVTVPLMTQPTGVMPRVKRLLGRELWDDIGNAKRTQFNERLVGTFRGDPILDLASLEVIGPAGDESSFEFQGKRYPALHPAYTVDGGHLNDLGQRLAGAAAIHFMADALRRGAPASEPVPAASAPAPAAK